MNKSKIQIPEKLSGAILGSKTLGDIEKKRMLRIVGYLYSQEQQELISLLS